MRSLFSLWAWNFSGPMTADMTVCLDDERNKLDKTFIGEDVKKKGQGGKYTEERLTVVIIIFTTNKCAHVPSLQGQWRPQELELAGHEHV